MTAFSRRDAGATALVALAIGTYLATHQAWNVWLVGDSHRWATVVIFALGLGAYLLDARLDEFPGLTAFMWIAYGSLVLAVIALATGSLTPLSLLVLGIVVCWAITTVRHLNPGGPEHPISI